MTGFSLLIVLPGDYLNLNFDNMYYATVKDSTIYIYNAETGAPHFTIPVQGTLTSYNANGNTLSVCYNDGRVEFYNLEKRSRIR
jgi:WD40 repeat protein